MQNKQTYTIISLSTLVASLCNQTGERVRNSLMNICHYLKAKDVIILIHNSHIPLTEQEERELQNIANDDTYIDMKE